MQAVQVALLLASRHWQRTTRRAGYRVAAHDRSAGELPLQKLFQPPLLRTMMIMMMMMMMMMMTMMMMVVTMMMTMRMARVEATIGFASAILIAWQTTRPVSLRTRRLACPVAIQRVTAKCQGEGDS